MVEIVVKTNMIDSIVGKPNYHTVRVLRLEVEENFKGYKRS